MTSLSMPKILISTSSVSREHGLKRIDVVGGFNYAEAILMAGGLPYFLANVSPKLAKAYIADCDGLLLSGGADYDPECYGEDPHPHLGSVGESRDQFELALYKAAKTKGIPVLGICRGIQSINVAEGGSLYQHVPDLAGSIQHGQQDIGGRPSHRVNLASDSLLAKAYGKLSLKTNSYHHQAVKDLGKDLRITARSADGIVEAVESTSQQFVLGLQWHPEMSFAEYSEHHLPFQLFVDAVKAHQLILS
ncbi:MAG: gamma-glutamyl-gamma-aminobutyrate hydrolase family protein [Deinococcales bacterium]